MSKPNRPKAATPSFLTGEQRINKLLAAAGFGSRRQVDELITDGRVEIDGKLVTQVGVKVDADVAKVTVDGEPLKRHRPVYYAVHKPEGFLCTNCDPDGRPRVIELVPSTARLFPVGRLDASSTGLILLTNDGELAQRLAHPKHCVPKTYFVVVAGQVDYDSMRRLQRGIYLAEGVARVDGATIRKVRKGCTEIDITLSEGKNREIRRVLARLGHKVVVLRRVAIGPLKLADMPEGSYRPLQDKEVAALYNAVDEIKRARNLERRERKKRNTVDGLAMSDNTADDSVGSASGRPSKKPPRQAVPIFDEESDSWDAPDEDDEEMMDAFPPISANPYRTDDDDESSDDEGLDDAILVTETDGQIFSNRKGSVLAFDDDEIDTEAIADDFEPHKVKRNANRDRSSREPRGGTNRAAERSRPSGDRPSGDRTSSRHSDSRHSDSRPTGSRYGGNRPRGDRGEGDRPARRSSAPRAEGAGNSERPTRGRPPAGAGGYGRRLAGNRSASLGSRPNRSGGSRFGDAGATPGVEGGTESTPARGRMRRTGSFTGNAPRPTEGSERPRRSSARMGGPRSSSGERSAGPRTGSNGRSSSGRTSSGGARSSAPRTGAPRTGASRSGASRSSAPRAGGARPASAGRPRRGGKPGNRSR